MVKELLLTPNQLILYDGSPPLIINSAENNGELVSQLSWVIESWTIIWLGWDNSINWVLVQLAPSVAITVYDPAERFETVSLVLFKLGQLYVIVPVPPLVDI